MWKYLLAAVFLVVGAFELFVALNAPLRKALMEASPVRSPAAGPAVFVVAGISALLTGLAIIAYGMFW